MRKRSVFATILLVTALAAMLLTACKKEKEMSEPTSAPRFYTVIFRDYDGTVLETQKVQGGMSAVSPEAPKREGYEFAGWNKDFSEIYRETDITAEYIRITDTTITVSTETMSAGGETATVSVTVANNPGILGMVLSVSYDENALTLKDCSNGLAMSALSFQKPSQYKSGCNFVWYGSETGEVLDGTILTLSFSVKAGAEAGNYPVTVSYGDRDIYDSHSNLIAPEITAGGVILTP